MSRSYKKHPACIHKDKSYKKIHNRKVRRATDVANGSKHKRITERYDICDYIFLPNERLSEMSWDRKKRYANK